jgi:hypothetical protein
VDVSSLPQSSAGWSEDILAAEDEGLRTSRILTDDHCISYVEMCSRGKGSVTDVPDVRSVRLFIEPFQDRSSPTRVGSAIPFLQRQIDTECNTCVCVWRGNRQHHRQQQSDQVPLRHATWLVISGGRGSATEMQLSDVVRRHRWQKRRNRGSVGNTYAGRESVSARRALFWLVHMHALGKIVLPDLVHVDGESFCLCRLCLFLGHRSLQRKT